MASAPPKVLISYSHDSPEHEQRVLTLAAHLRRDGVDCMIDQYVLVPEEGWTLWMERRFEASDFVLMACTETYYRRVRDDEEIGKGLGVRWEGGLIYRALYRDGRRNTKFIPILFEASDSSHIPGPVEDTIFYLVQTERGYEDLYRRITDQPRAVKPELGKLRSLPPAEHKSEGAVGREVVLSNVPERNPFFTGREQLLIQIRDELTQQGRVVLSGLGGVGKSQTAIEYAHRYATKYSELFWFTADSHQALTSAYTRVAALLGVSPAEAQDQTFAVNAVKYWLASHEGWLLIFDNVDRADTIKPFVSLKPTGHIVLTSRVRVFDTIGIVKPVELNEMSSEEAKTFLLKRTGREYQGGVELNSASELTAKLGFLPLALEQAGAFIVENQTLFQDYLRSFSLHMLELLNISPVAGDYSESVHTTWSMNFRQLECESEAAAELLRLSAFLSPDNIPLEILAKGAPELGDVISAALAGAQEDPLVLDKTLKPLSRFSLIRRNIETRTYSLHRLVQAVVRGGLDLQTQRRWGERAVRAANRIFPDAEFSNWSLCDRLLPQALACAELISEWDFEFPESVRLLHATGIYLYERGRYAESEPLLEQTLALREKTLGPEHPDVAVTINNLAELYRSRGWYAKAEPFYERALAIRKKALGPLNPDLATSFNNLARLYRFQGQYGRAEPLYEQAQLILERALGPKHLDVARNLRSLAGLYRDNGQYRKAESLLEQAQTTFENALNPEHQDIAWCLHNMALLYDKEGQYEKAEHLYEQACAIFEKSLGPEHPDLAWCLLNMALLYDKKDQYENAELRFRRALAIFERSLGPEHPHVGLCLEKYALMLGKMDRSEEGALFEARAKAIRAKQG
jgi:tetratricopeptide (TPR) repeat protein